MQKKLISPVIQVAGYATCEYYIHKILSKIRTVCRLSTLGLNYTVIHSRKETNCLNREIQTQTKKKGPLKFGTL